jgi:hypothetical protein
MTPQEIETQETHLSTADLAATARGYAPDTAKGEPNPPLFAQNDAQDFRQRWEKIQIGFVDEPRTAVQQADELVASVIKLLAEVFATERQKLESAWDNKDNVSTEDLRVALRRYRSFFDRLLSV